MQEPVAIVCWRLAYRFFIVDDSACFPFVSRGRDGRKSSAFRGQFSIWYKTGKVGKEGNVWEAPMGGGADKEAMIESVSIDWA